MSYNIWRFLRQKEFESKMRLLALLCVVFLLSMRMEFVDYPFHEMLRSLN